MAPPTEDASDTSSVLSTDISYDGGSESSTTRSPHRRSRLDSFLSSDSSTSRGSRGSSSSSLKSILKKRRRSSLPKNRKSPAKNVRPIGQISMIKNPVIRSQVRGFVSEYSANPDFEAFSLSVDGIPFVALSLMNAEPELCEKFRKAQPPTPMKKHTPGVNSPRKRALRARSSSSGNSKCVRFSDEGGSSVSPAHKKKKRYRKRRLSAEDEEELRELGETISDAQSWFF
uniref:NET domain-containing protein n=1 Tax=Caenorhabditis tropicalis TaxID=1561998 RepID=A0A1I7TQY3_9PELO